ncbi:hypothetical protein KGF57_002283 [Candida theae]|uniref:Uncharacterized protein n=1 Tax=Candida theae TaxID=1198502 RepID=A0AAD5BF99_9ASCO|nr:uncharacterized protein KGF57_002283 [Candida theae]KAI5958849.1 hypothetical protein KGF57_002283 [Candida theae]
MLKYTALIHLLAISQCLLQDHFKDLEWTDTDTNATVTTTTPRFNLTEITPYFLKITQQRESTQSQPHVYAISTLDKLQSSTHISKLSNHNNIFYIKSRQSSLQFDHKLEYWTLLTANSTTVTDATATANTNTNTNTDTNTLTSSTWIPITSCLESIHGSGGYLSRYITIHLEQTLDQIGEATLGIPPLYFAIGTSLAMGKRVGFAKQNTLLFSCAINPGEVAQFYIRPHFVNVVGLKRVWFKFKGKKLHYVGYNFIKPFKMLVVDTPEHQCWVSRNINDLQCGEGGEKKQCWWC